MQAGTRYFVGFVAMIPFFSVEGFYHGPVARALGGADVAMLAGLQVAAAVYLFTCRSFNTEHDRLRAFAADLGLE
jgi:purine-cytosine permease-like protein